MKKFFVLIFLSTISMAAVCQEHHGGSRLYLKMRDNSTFTVKLDGQFYDIPTDRFRSGRLQSGWHRLIVYEKFGPHGQSRITYRGRVEIPRASKVYAVVGASNNLIIKRIEPIHSNNPPTYNNNYNPVSLNMQQLSYTLTGASFESDKLTIAKQAVSSNGVYADQVLQIMQNFSFESTKVDFAKFAYAYCADKNNYYLVNNGFTFNSSINDLNNYVASQGNSGNYNNNFNGNTYNNNYDNNNNNTWNHNQQNNNRTNNSDEEEGNGGDW